MEPTAGAKRKVMKRTPIRCVFLFIAPGSDWSGGRPKMSASRIVFNSFVGLNEPQLLLTWDEDARHLGWKSHIADILLSIERNEADRLKLKYNLGWRRKTVLDVFLKKGD